MGPDERERLRILQASGLVDGPPIPGLDDLCHEASRHFGIRTAIVTLLEDDVQVFRAKAGIEGASTPRNVAFCNYTILEDRVFVVSDAALDERFASNPLVTGPPFIRFYAGGPLIFMEDIRLGALCLIDPEPRQFSLGERAELQEMADRAVNIIATEWFQLGGPK